VGEGGGEGESQAVAASVRWPAPASLISRARSLRANATDAERALWSLLRSRRLAGAKFRRQRPFGPYVLDFFCAQALLAIEADGGQHLSDAGRKSDRRRTLYREQRGVRVLRFSDRDILLDRDGVLERIAAALESETVGDRPSP
jgi:very-short-patch-repair endonuclease